MSLSALTRADPYKLEPGPHAVRTIDQDWRDAARDRTIPVRLYIPADVDGPQPVILLSHGLGGTRAAMSYIAEHWTGHGYVCIAMQHPGSDESVWRNVRSSERMAQMRQAANLQQALARCRDVAFVIDHLMMLAADRSSELADKVDLSRIGIAGHSFGAQTVQAILGQQPALARSRDAATSRADPRVAAGIAFSPAYHGPRGTAAASFETLQKPCFHFTGTRDESVLMADAEPEERRVPYDAIDADDQYLMIFTDGTHAVFGGSRPNQAERGLTRRIHDGVRQASTAFWDMTLRNDAAAREWLEGEPGNAALQPLGTYERKHSTTRPAM